MIKNLIHNPTAAVGSPLFLAANPGVEQAIMTMMAVFLPIIFFLFLGASILFGLGFVLRLLNGFSKKQAPRGGRRRRRRVG